MQDSKGKVYFVLFAENRTVDSQAYCHNLENLIDATKEHNL